MPENDKVLLRVNYPKGVLVFLGVTSAFSLLFFGPLSILFLINSGIYGFNWARLLICAVLLSIPVVRLCMIRRSFLWITATESGLQVKRVFSSNQRFSWDEIVRAAGPRFGIPADTTYVYARGGRRLVLPRNIDGYAGLLDLIQSRAQNVGPGSLPRNLWRRGSNWTWNKVLIFFGIFLVYVVTRAIAGF